MAEGKYSGTNNEREGLVVRPRHETISPTLNGRLSFKMISNRFRLPAGEYWWLSLGEATVPFIPYAVGIGSFNRTP